VSEAVALGWRQFRLERKQFWRNPTAAFFGFMLPIVFLLIIGSLTPASDRDIVIPGIAGMNVMASTFNAIAMNMTFRREQGLLKRMRGTPMPTGAYLGGIFGNVALNGSLQVAIVVFGGAAIFGLPMPYHWDELIIFTIVGIFSFTALGIAFSHVIPNFDAAPAYTNIVFLPVIFISGVFYDVDNAPAFLQDIARVLPLTHIIDGLSAALVTGTSLADNAGNLAVVAAWGAFGTIFAVRGFSWDAKRD